MRKYRKWWMGFGFGIMIGAMLLQLITFAKEQRALPGEEKIYTQQQLDQAVSDAIAALPSPDVIEAVHPSDDPQDQVDSTAPLTESADATASNPDAADNRIVAFYIYRGMNLTEVARSLQALGLIETADDFIDAARPISRKIEIGTATFTGQPTYDEIIAELTRSKDG